MMFSIRSGFEAERTAVIGTEREEEERETKRAKRDK